MELTEKWVARYRDKDGKDGMGMANHYSALAQLVQMIVHNGGYNIIISDETLRTRVIDIEHEVNHE